MCERINLSVWVESIDIYIYDMRIYMTLYRFISLLTYPESSEKIYYLWTALVIEVTSGTGMHVTSQHVGLRLPLFAAWNWQQLQKSHVPRKYPCHHVIQQMLFFNWSNNSNKIGTRPTLCQSLALKLQFSSTSSTILRLRVFFLTESLQSAGAFALTWSVCMSQILASKKKGRTNLNLNLFTSKKISKG